MSIHASRFSSRSQRTRQPNRHGPRFAARVVRWLLLLLGLVALIQGLRLTVDLLAPLPNLPNEIRYPISIKSYDRTNLLLVSFQGSDLTYLAVLSISAGSDPELLALDPATLVNLPRGLGQYRLGDIPKQARLDNLGVVNLLRDTVTRTLAIPLDGYLAADANAWPEVSGEFGAVANNILGDLGSTKFFWQVLTLKPWEVGLHGSISGLQLLNLALAARDQSQVDVIDPSLAATTGATPLGSTAPVIDPTTFDENYGALFQEKSIVRARPRVSIVNSSGIAGAGSVLARIVTNLGGDVVTVTSGDEVTKSVITDHLGGSNLSGRLAPLIKASVSTDHNVGRADIEIVIGSDTSGIF